MVNVLGWQLSERRWINADWHLRQAEAIDDSKVVVVGYGFPKSEDRDAWVSLKVETMASDNRFDGPDWCRDRVTMYLTVEQAQLIVEKLQNAISEATK